jgi:hypothetical protein
MKAPKILPVDPRPSKAHPEHRHERKQLEKGHPAYTWMPGVILALTGLVVAFNVERDVKKCEERREREEKDEGRQRHQQHQRGRNDGGGSGRKGRSPDDDYGYDGVRHDRRRRGRSYDSRAADDEDDYYRKKQQQQEQRRPSSAYYDDGYADDDYRRARRPLYLDDKDGGRRWDRPIYDDYGYDSGYPSRREGRH